MATFNSPYADPTDPYMGLPVEVLAEVDTGDPRSEWSTLLSVRFPTTGETMEVWPEEVSR